MKKLVKVLMIAMVSFIGAFALFTTSAKAFSLTGVQLTRIYQGKATNIGITNPTHKTREYHVIVKPAGKKAVKFNTYIRSGETVEIYTTRRNNGGILYSHKLPRKFTVTAYRMSNKQNKREAKHGYIDAGMKWTKHKMAGGIK